MKRNLIWNFFKYFLFFALIASFKAWFTWNMKYLYIFLIGCCVGFFVTHKFFFETKRNNIRWLIILYTAVYFGNLCDGILATITPMIILFPFFFVVTLKAPQKEDLLSTIRVILSLLLTISLVGWISYYLGVSSSYTTIEYGDYQGGAQYIYENHYIYLINVTRLETELFPRFCFVFLEPGYLGCLLAMLLYIGNYKLDKPNTVFYISLFFTFSLAGYILTLVGYFYYSYMKSKKRILWLFTFVSLLSISISFTLLYNKGDNYVNEMILLRLEYDEDTGIAGNNRSTYNTDKYFWGTFVNSSDLFFGQGRNALKRLHDADADWKVYVMQHGIIGTFLFLFFIFYPCLWNKNRTRVFMLSIIYFLIFVQTVHLIHSMMYLTIFSLGVNRCVQEKQLKKKIV